MNPFQRYRAAPILSISLSGAAYHTWSCRFQLTSRLLPNWPNPICRHSAILNDATTHSNVQKRS